MPAVWSFNTTVRNPERMQSFLRALKELEGRDFDEECQRDFFALQIKNRLYRPTIRTLRNQQDLVNKVYDEQTAEEMPNEIVDGIIELYDDPALRGRTTAGILNRFGLCIASAARGRVQITELGNRWLENEIDDRKLFLRFFLKWQYPNPLERRGYSQFNIKPFIGTLALIHEVNKRWSKEGHEPKGISKKEFLLFIPSLKDCSEIDEYAERIIRHRLASKQKSGRERARYEQRFSSRRIEEISETEGNLRDYMDSAIRYFRISEFIYLRGNGNYVDISPDHKIEVEKLLESDVASPGEFEDLNEYLAYLADISLPELPWETEADLEEIRKVLTRTCRAISERINEEVEFEEFLESLVGQEVVQQIEKLREYKNKLRIKELESFRYDTRKLGECIDKIVNLLSPSPQIVTTRPSLDLEWFVSLSLIVLNDDKTIIPSYTLGDDGLPTGFTSSIADIKCLYESFGMTVEVTLLRGRDQWFTEGQPVMRHLRNFEEEYNSYEEIYCLFVAPYLHRDTLSTFWNAVRGEGYEGRRQKIIPISINQYIKILTLVGTSLGRDEHPHHIKYKELLEMLYAESAEASDVHQWVETFDSVIEHWGNTLP